MPLLPRREPNESTGDFHRRRARFAAFLLLLLLPATLWLFARVGHIWPTIASLEGAPFMVAATALGALLAVLPIALVTTLLVAVWHGVESVFQPRSHATPTADRLIVATGILVWFSPSLALFAWAVRAIAQGAIRFTRPAREYLLATDPLAFWQGIGFLLIVAAALAYPAWHYWRSRLAKAARN